jgi:hypothetical protein
VDHEVVRVAATGEVASAVEREGYRRRELGFPPFGGLAEVRGDPAAVAAACVVLGDRMDVIGPSAGRALLRAPTTTDLCDALAAADLTSARALGRLRIDVDPLRV